MLDPFLMARGSHAFSNVVHQAILLRHVVSGSASVGELCGIVLAASESAGPSSPAVA